MPIIINLIISILLGIGFYFFGFIIINYFKIKKIINNVSKPEFQYCLFGIAIFLFFLYPIFFFGYIKSYLFKYFSFFLIFLSLVGIFYLRHSYTIFLKNIFEKKNIKIYNVYFIFIFLYFLLSLGPITSGDSVSYHGYVARYIYLHGEFPRNSFDFNTYLAGVGEFLNAFALSVNAFQFTSFVQFLGLISMLGIIEKLLSDNSVDQKNSQFFYLLLLGSPVLIFLISSSKPQFFYTALILFCYSCLININKFYSINDKFKVIIISVIFSNIAIAAKLSFSISFFLIFFNYFFLIKKNFQFYKIILIAILISSAFILPSLFWKQNLYNYQFYHFFFNPFPMNIPGFDSAYLSIHNYEREGFPLSLIFPMSFSKITMCLGFGCLLFFFFVKEKFNNKKIFLFNIIFFLIAWSCFGQKSPRFYLEIYLFSLLISIVIFKNIYERRFFKFVKFIIYIQSLIVFLILIYGVLITFPGSLSERLNEKTLSENAYGYNLYKWLNKSIPPNSKIITNHRGVFYSSNKTFYIDFVNYVNFDDKFKRDFWLLKLKKEKPTFILFYGKKNEYNYLSYNFKNCLDGIYLKKNNVGFYESRNPFNRNHETYNGYIYKFNYSKLPYCVTKKINFH
jgi:hypothetical protein